MAKYSLFLKFADSEERATGIFGKSKDAKHPAWIEILSYGWSVSSWPGKDFQVTTDDDAAGTAIGRAYGSGTLYPTVVVEATSNGSVVGKTVMHDAYVSSFMMGNTEGRPMFMFGLNWRAIEGPLAAASGSPSAARTPAQKPSPAPVLQLTPPWPAAPTPTGGRMFKGANRPRGTR